MIRESIIPKTKEEWLSLRTKDLTSTDVSALFGISPYSTAFELWHRKKEGTIIELDPNERMEWGNYLQDSIAKKFADAEKMTIREKNEYIRIPELRIGSSFDFEIQSDQNRIFEIKNVDRSVYADQWIEEEGKIEAPPHIEMQVQHQLLVSGCKSAVLGVLVGGNKGILINRKADALIHSAILDKAVEFWASIDANTPPVPDFTKDAEIISKVYGYSEIGKVFDVRCNNKL